MQPAALLLCVLLAVCAACALAECPSLSLDGEWDFRFAPDDRGEKERWFDDAGAWKRKLRVPGCWNGQGVGQPSEKMLRDAPGVGWYRRTFRLKESWKGKRVWLVVGGVHRTAKLWINGRYLGEHVGYPVAWRVDVTGALRPGTQRVVLAVDSRHDPSKDPLVGTFDVIDFMDLAWGGIHGSVRLEGTGETWIEDAFAMPDPKTRSAKVQVTLAGYEAPARIRYEARSLRSGRALAQGLTDTTGAQATLDLSLPDAPLWSPEHPDLIELKLSLGPEGAPADEKTVRFGMRRLEVQGGQFLLNGDPFFLRGYGDDFNFPRELLPTSVASWKRYLQKRKDFGFNGVRHHSMMPTEAYLQAADEVGMLVQPELPIAYYVHLNSAKPETHDVYRRVWSDYIRQMRNHPSVMAWCMGNELWSGFPLGPELYEKAKALDPTRPVIDSDGIGIGADRLTLDYLPTQFNEGALNWAFLQTKYRIPDAKKPVIVHEMSNISCLPDPAEAAQFDGAIRPFWLEQMQAAVERQALQELLPDMLRASWKLQASLLKLNIETARLGPGISGYHQWLVRDYWTQSSGIESIMGKTRALSAEMARRFNGPVAVLWEHDRVNYASGAKIPIELFLSDYREGGAQAIGRMTVRLGGERVHLEVPPGSPVRGRIGPWIGEISAPVVQTPRKLSLIAEAEGTRNEWSVWIWPQAPAPGKGIVVTNVLSAGVLRDLEAGARVLLTNPLGTFPTQNATFKPAWWKGDENGDFVHGNLFTDHPGLKSFPHDGYGDQQAWELLDNRPVVNLDEVPGSLQPIVWALDVPWKMRRMAYLWEAKVGKGRLLVSAFDLSPAARQKNPAAAWLFSLLTRYASSNAFQPVGSLSAEWLRSRAAQFSLPESAECVEGFARYAGNGEGSEWFTHRGESVPLRLARLTDGKQAVTWFSAPLARGATALVWSGAMGYRSQPDSGPFELCVNGKKALEARVADRTAQWTGAGGYRLAFVPQVVNGEDAFGIFYLTLPPGAVEVGKPVELSWRALGSGSRRWVSVVPYRDVVRELKGE